MSSSSVQAMYKLRGCYRQISRQVGYQRSSHLSYRKCELKSLTFTLCFALAIIYYVHLYRTTRGGLSFKKRQLVVHAAKPYKSLPLTRRRLAKLLRNDNMPSGVKMSKSGPNEPVQKQPQTKINSTSNLTRRQVNNKSKMGVKVISRTALNKISQFGIKPKLPSVEQRSSSSMSRTAIPIVKGLTQYNQTLSKQRLEPTAKQIRQSYIVQHTNQTKGAQKMMTNNHTASILSNLSKKGDEVTTKHTVPVLSNLSQNLDRVKTSHAEPIKSSLSQKVDEDRTNHNVSILSNLPHKVDGARTNHNVSILSNLSQKVDGVRTNHTSSILRNLSKKVEGVKKIF